MRTFLWLAFVVLGVSILALGSVDAPQVAVNVAALSLQPSSADDLFAGGLDRLADTRLVLEDHERTEYAPVIDRAYDLATGKRVRRLGAGRYDVVLNLSNRRKLVFENLTVAGRVPVRFQEVETGFTNSVAVDLSGLNFTTATYTAIADQPEFWKCKDWNFTTQTCTGSWMNIRNLTVGQPYAIALSANDPGFGEYNSSSGAATQTTTSVTPQNGSQLNFTPLATQYLIVGYGEAQGSSGTVSVTADLALNDTSTNNTLFFEPTSILNPNTRMPFFGFNVTNLNPNVTQKLSTRFYSETTATTTTFTNTRTFAIAINNSDAVTNESLAARNLGIAGAFRPMVNLTYVPTANQRILVLARAEILPNSTIQSTSVQLTHNGTVRGFSEIEGQDLTDVMQFATHLVVNATAGVAQNFSLQFRAETSVQNKSFRNSRISVIPLTDVFFNSSEGQSDSTIDTEQTKVSLAFALAETQPVLLLGSADVNFSLVGGGNMSVETMYLDGTALGNMTRSAQDATDDQSFIVAALENLGAGEHVMNITFRRTLASGIAGISRARLTAVPLPNAPVAAQPVCPQNISVSTTLTGNITCPGTAVQLLADNITLDCAGFTITYGANGSSFVSGVTAKGRNNVTVRNCVIRDNSTFGIYSQGINFTNTNASLVLNNTIFVNSSNLSYGIWLDFTQFNRIINNSVRTQDDGTSFTNPQYMHGIFLENTALFTNITGNSIIVNGSDDSNGIRLIGGVISNTLIANNTVSTHGQYRFAHGMLVFNASDNVIADNIVSVNASRSQESRGIFLLFPQTSNTVLRNRITVVGGATDNQGIRIATSAVRNTVRENVIVANSSDSAQGIRISDQSHNNTVANNTIRTGGNGSENVAIFITDQSGENNITRNVLEPVGGFIDGIGVWINGGSNLTWVANNTIQTRGSGTNNHGILVIANVSQTSIIDNVISTNGTGIRNFGVYLVTDVTFSRVERNIITTNGTSFNAGIQLEDNANNNTLQDNVILTNGNESNNYGILFVTLSSNNTATHNVIRTNGSASNAGVRAESHSNNNRILFTNISASGPGSAGIQVLAANGTFVNGTLLNNTAEWINTSANTFANITNVTFSMPDGDINILPLVHLSGTQLVTKARLNVSFNLSYVNDTNLSFLNTSAVVTLRGILFADPEPTVRFAETDAFVTCPVAICQEISFAGGVFTFNVTQWSAFSSVAAVTNAPPTLAQVILNTTNVLTNDTNQNLTVFIINATDSDGSAVENITDWRVNNQSIALLNLPFETNVSNVTVTVRDYSLMGANATLGDAVANGLPAWNLSGVRGGGYVFDGINDVINTSSMALKTADNFTLTVWFKPTSMPATNVSGSAQAILWQGEAGLGGYGNGIGGTEDEMHLVLGRIVNATPAFVGNSLYFFFGNGDEAFFTQNINLSADFNDTENWTFAAVTVSNVSVAPVGELYVNGVFVTRDTDTDLQRVNASNWTAPLRIGRMGSAARPFNGTIDEVIVFNRSLSAAQILQMYREVNVSGRHVQVMHADETAENEAWQVCATPNDHIIDGNTTCSNNVTVAAVAADACPRNITASTTLAANISCSQTAVQLLADNIVLDCDNYTVSFGTNGSGNDFGILAQGRVNVTVRNCIILDNHSAGDMGVGIRFVGVNASLIVNTSVTTNGTNSNYGIEVANRSAGNQIVNASVQTFGNETDNYGIYLNGVLGAVTYTNVTGTSVRANGTDVSYGVHATGFAGVLSNFSMINSSVFTCCGGSDDDGLHLQTVQDVNISRSVIVANGTSGTEGINTATAVNIRVEDTVIAVVGAGSAITLAGSRFNITRNRLTTGITGTDEGLSASGTNSTIQNNYMNFSGAGNAVEITGIDNFFDNNTVIVTSPELGSARAIVSTARAEFRGTRINATGASANRGILLAGPLNRFFLTNMSVNGTSSIGIDITSGNGSLFNATILNDTTSWMSSAANLQNNFTNTTFEQPFGSINILPLVQVNGTQNVTKARLNSSINRSYVNDTNLSFFNVSSIVTLRGLAVSNPQAVIDYGDNNGTFSACPLSICTILSNLAGLITFSVSQWSAFAIRPTPTVSVINLTPVTNGQFLLNGTVSIAVNATATTGAIDTVLANVTLPDGTLIVVQLPAQGTDIFNLTWLNLTQRGRYNVTFFANGTEGGANGSMGIFFVRRGLDVIDVQRAFADENGEGAENLTLAEYAVSVTANLSGVLNLTVTVNGSRVRVLNVSLHASDSVLSVLKVSDEQPTETGGSVLFGIDPAGLSFTNITALVNASGERLRKCANWNFTGNDCLGNFTDVQNITPGALYAVSLNATDPGFSESSPAVDVAMAPFDNQTFVIAYIRNDTNQLVFSVMNTTNATIVGTTVVDATMDGDSRVAVSAMNSTHFILAWIDGPTDDLTHAIYLLNGSIVFGPSDADANVGLFTDVSVAELGEYYVLCNANDADNDADYRQFFNNGSPRVTENNVDTNMNPEATLQNLVACAATNATQWAYFWFDDQNQNDVTLAILNGTNGTLTTADIDGTGGETAQVAITALDNDKFALAYYDSNATDQNVEVAIRGVDNSVILAPLELDPGAGVESRVAIAAVRRNATETRDSFVVVWWNQSSDRLMAAVLNGTGGVITGPFTVDTQQNVAFRLHDVIAHDPLTNNSICPGKFIVAYSNATDQGIFKGFDVNGSAWDGNCVTGAADIFVNASEIGFNVSHPYELENITMNATIRNIGTAPASNVFVQFFDNTSAPFQIGDNFTIVSLPAGGAVVVNVTSISIIGNRTIRVVADPINTVVESNETNNNATRQLNVQAWSIYFGNNVGNLTLDSAANITKYRWNASDAGFVYFFDLDSNFSFAQLQALGRNTTNGTAVNDFGEADVNLNMTGFNDSVVALFAVDNNSTPNETRNLTIFDRPVNLVPVLNSTNVGTFITGILWDTADDTNGQYDLTDKEDLVFVANINLSKTGASGSGIDYEVRVPSLLRQYRPVRNQTAFLVEIG
jgi:hypothetical protein